MINNTNKDYIFSSFQNYMMEGTSGVVKSSNNPSVPIAQMSIQDTLDINSDSINKKKKILFGSTIASTILTAGVLSLFLGKGVHGSSLSKLVSKFSSIAPKMNKTQGCNLGNAVTYHAKKTVKRTVDTMQATANFTAMKDFGCDKALRLTKPTAKFADVTRNFFRKVSDKTLRKQYRAAEVGVKGFASTITECTAKNIRNLSETDRLQKIDIKGTTKTLQEWVEILEQHSKGMDVSFNEHFSLGALKNRGQRRAGMLTGLSDKIQKRFFGSPKSFITPKNYRTYATEDLTSEAREVLQREILAGKQRITNNIPLISDGLKTIATSFDDMILPTDNASREIFVKLKESLEAFKKCSGPNEAKAREQIAGEIKTILEKLQESVYQNGKYTSVDMAHFNTLVRQMRKTVSSTAKGSKGLLEEAMTILNGLNATTLKSTGKKIISDETHRELSGLSKRITKDLSKATELEAGEYFLKQAELEVGSAAPDVISLLFPIGVGAYSIGKADNKEERVSATLTTCIPLVGSFATFIYGTTKMLSGTKNLIFSLVTGGLLSMAGDYADKLYKKYKNSGSIKEVAKEEYNKIWTGIEPQMKKFEEDTNPTNKK